jgi:hypothetical protein
MTSPVVGESLALVAGLMFTLFRTGKEAALDVRGARSLRFRLTDASHLCFA